MRSHSRGSVQLKTKNPHHHSSILFNYMAHEEDWREFRAGNRITRDIMQQAAFTPYLGSEIMPSNKVQTDDEIDAFVRAHGETSYHSSCSCSMGCDDRSVVDKDGKMHSLEGLGVIDASIMPRIVTGNLNAPTIMMAEKLADVIRGHTPLPAVKVPVYIHTR